MDIKNVDYYVDDIFTIDIDPKTILWEKAMVRMLMGTHYSPIKWYNGGLHFVNTLRS